MTEKYNLPDSQGHFGPYGGLFVAETLMGPLEELREAYEHYFQDEEFLKELEKNPAYEGINIRKEYGRMKAWLLTPKGKGKYPSKQRFFNWLSKANPEDGHRNENHNPGGLSEAGRQTRENAARVKQRLFGKGGNDEPE